MMCWIRMQNLSFSVKERFLLPGAGRFRPEEFDHIPRAYSPGKNTLTARCLR